jgi:hypothetical protein
MEKFYGSIDIIEINFDDILKPMEGHNFFKIEVSLVIVTGSNGSVYLFKLLDHNEMIAQVIKNAGEMGTGEWLWSKLAPALPNNIANLAMNGSTIKINLNHMKN